MEADCGGTVLVLEEELLDRLAPLLVRRNNGVRMEPFVQLARDRLARGAARADEVLGGGRAEEGGGQGNGQRRPHLKGAPMPSLSVPTVWCGRTDCG